MGDQSDKARFTVYKKGVKPRHFAFQKNEVAIGRDPNADVVLPDVSVSRRHLSLTHQDSVWRFNDQSSNQVLLRNGAFEAKGEIAKGDWFQVGPYLLHFTFAQQPSDDTLNSEKPTLMPPLQPLELSLLQKASVSSEKGEFNWLLGDTAMTFGGEGGIPLHSHANHGHIALIVWQMRAHVLKKIARSATIEVNGVAIQEKALTLGDRIRIGESCFDYVI